jgi:integrase
MAPKRKANAQTLAEVSATRKQLATKTREELEDISSPELVKLCRAAQIGEVRAVLETHESHTKVYKLIQSGAEFISVSTASKEELIQAIVENTEEERQNIERDRRLAELENLQKCIPPELDLATLKSLNQKAAYLDDINDSDIGTIAVKTWTVLRDYIRSLWDVENKCWLPGNATMLRIANALFLEITTRPSFKTGNTITPATALKYKSLILNAMGEAIEDELKTNPNPVHQAKYREEFGVFTSYVNEAFSALHRTKNLTYQSNLNERQRKVKTIKVKSLVEWARKVLSDLNPDTKKTAWKDVYIALAILTGRRKGELTSTGHFKATGEKTVNFSGQLKTKGRENSPDSYDIPVLCRAYDIENAIKWLEENSKRDSNPDIAHKKYTSDLNKRVKEVFPGRVQFVNDAGEEIEDSWDKAPTFHDCRKIYAEICADALRPGNMTIRKYISTILGHSDEDNTTATSYDADFDVVDGKEI